MVFCKKEANVCSFNHQVGGHEERKELPCISVSCHLYVLVAIQLCWHLPSGYVGSCHSSYVGSCHLVMMVVATMSPSWLPCMLKELGVFAKEQYKNTIKWSRQPFWYILFENASCRKSAMNLHQFMFFTSFSFACTTQIPGQEVVASEIKMGKHQKTGSDQLTDYIGVKRLKEK